jgi:hypothetical protein
MPARGLAAKSDSGLLITARYLLTREDLLGYMNSSEFKLRSCMLSSMYSLTMTPMFLQRQSYNLNK